MNYAGCFYFSKSVIPTHALPSVLYFNEETHTLTTLTKLEITVFE